MPPLTPDLPLIEVPSRAAWRAWLISHADSSRGVWAVTVKKSALESGEEYVSARDVNEECLCVGWIDSKPGRIDERHTALLCTPRKPGSGWWGALVVPDDLANALGSIPDARRDFDAFPPSARRGILEWIQNAQRVETRHKRVAETAELAGQNRRALQWPRTQ